jgi:hypothetical protein
MTSGVGWNRRTVKGEVYPDGVENGVSSGFIVYARVSVFSGAPEAEGGLHFHLRFHPPIPRPPEARPLSCRNDGTQVTSSITYRAASKP